MYTNKLIQDKIYYTMLAIMPDVQYDAMTDVDNKKVTVCCDSPRLSAVSRVITASAPDGFEIEVEYDPAQTHDDMRRWVA